MVQEEIQGYLDDIESVAFHMNAEFEGENIRTLYIATEAIKYLIHFGTIGLKEHLDKKFPEDH